MSTDLFAFWKEEEEEEEQKNKEVDRLGLPTHVCLGEI